jgi:hypothetical protein
MALQQAELQRGIQRAEMSTSSDWCLGCPSVRLIQARGMCLPCFKEMLFPNTVLLYFSSHAASFFFFIFKPCNPALLRSCINNDWAFPYKGLPRRYKWDQHWTALFKMRQTEEQVKEEGTQPHTASSGLCSPGHQSFSWPMSYQARYVSWGNHQVVWSSSQGQARPPGLKACLLPGCVTLHQPLCASVSICKLGVTLVPTSQIACEAQWTDVC